MQEWHYETAVDLGRTLPERLREFPREPDMLGYGIRSASALAIRGWLKAYHRLRIFGRENLPGEDKSFVMVCNHASHLDALCLLAAVPLRRLHQAFPAAAADYFFISGARIAAAALFVNALPFDRSAHVRHSLRLCRELLCQPGNVLILFPEGTRSRNGSVGEFRSGIGKILAGTDVAALPCFLSGAGRALPKGAWIPRPRQMVLNIGLPQYYASYPLTRASANAIADDLRAAVIRSSI